MNKFTEQFDTYAIAGDHISVEASGFTITATIIYDQDARIDDDDTHNTDPSVTGCNKKQQKRLLAARKAWFNDEWFYCGIVLEVSKGDVTFCEHAASLWGIECNYPGTDNSYLTEVANELLPEAIEAAEIALAKMMAAAA
jgi:hypothetical protein